MTINKDGYLDIPKLKDFCKEDDLKETVLCNTLDETLIKECNKIKIKKRKVVRNQKEHANAFEKTKRQKTKRQNAEQEERERDHRSIFRKVVMIESIIGLV